MRHLIHVRPMGERAWMVGHASVENPMVFASGARAEAAARRLAEQLADHGHSVEITITLRDGALAGRFVTAPPLRGEAEHRPPSSGRSA